MSDINKTIAELKELMAEAASSEWEALEGITPMQFHIYGRVKGIHEIRGKIASHLFGNDAAFIVAMRNALPELIAEIESAHDMAKCFAAALARAERAEADSYAIANDALATENARIQMQAERDVLAERLSLEVFNINLGLAKGPYPYTKAEWLEWAAREARAWLAEVRGEGKPCQK